MTSPMKFRDVEDVKLFLIEVGRTDLLESIDDEYKPSADLFELLYDKRKPLQGLRDHKRSRAAKQSWRHHRYNYMSGIKRFHKSTKGKRFHRELGNFLTRTLFTNRKSIFAESMAECVASIASLRTHVYIEKQYYMPLYESIEYSMFSDDLLAGTLRLEESVMGANHASGWSGGEILEEDVDIILRSINPKCLAGGICEITEGNFEETETELCGVIEAELGSYPEIVRSFFNN